MRWKEKLIIALSGIIKKLEKAGASNPSDKKYCECNTPPVGVTNEEIYEHLTNNIDQMKEQTLMNMKHDMGKLAEGLHNTIRDLVGVNTLVQGLLETVKRLPGYEEAIADILANYKEEEEEAVSKPEEKKLEL